MTEFQRVFQSLKNTCINNKFPYMLIGGMANIIHGSTRTTQDVDVVVFVEYHELGEVVAAFQDAFLSRVSDPLSFMKNHFVLPLTHRKTEIDIDVSIGFSQFEQRALARCKKMKFGDIELNVCSAEDLILFKLVAARPRDLLDVQELMHRYRGKLDTQYLKSTAEGFSEVARSDVPDNLAIFLSKYYNGD